MLIRIRYENSDDKEQAVTIKEKEDSKIYFSNVRETLTKRNLMTPDDRFTLKGAILDTESENELELEAGLKKSPENDADLLTIRRPKPPESKEEIQEPEPESPQAQAFSILRTSDGERFSLRKLLTTPLAELRTSLSWMQDSDQFQREDGGKINQGDEETETIQDVLSEEQTLRVYRAGKKKFTGSPEKIPTPEKTDTDRTKLGFQIEGDQDGDEFEEERKKLASQEVAGIQVDKFDDFKNLSAKKQIALIVKLDLLKGLVVKNTPEGGDFIKRAPNSPVKYTPLDGKPSSRIPKFSSARYQWTNVSRAIHEIRKSNVYAAEASGSAGMDGLGDIKLNVSYRHEQEDYHKHENSKTWAMFTVLIPKAVIDINRDQEICASNDLLKAVKEVLKGGNTQDTYTKLHEKIFSKFGYYFPCEVTVGGKLENSNSFELTKDSNIKEELDKFNVGMAASVDAQEYGKYSGSTSVGGTQQSSDKKTILETMLSMSSLVTGGDENTVPTVTNFAPWSASLSSLSRWRVIDTCDLIPVISLLPDDLRNACVSLISNWSVAEMDRRHTLVDMNRYIRSEQADFLGTIL